MIIFITYSNDLYSESRDYCLKMAIKKGKADRAIAYRPEDIDSHFREAHSNILNQKTGNGLWLWKPYFLCKTLDEEANSGDIVLYCDAGSYFFRNCKPIIASMKDQDVWVSNIPLIEKQFTKPELFDSMRCVGEKFEDTNQVQGNFIAIRKTEKGVAFAREWFRLCCNIENIGDKSIDKKRRNELDFTFLGHRYDQSILSLLSKKEGIKIHLDPSQYGRIPIKYYSSGRLFKAPDNYGEYAPSIILHRGRKPEFGTCLNQWLSCWLPKAILKRTVRGYKLFEHDKRSFRL